MEVLRADEAPVPVTKLVEESKDELLRAFEEDGGLTEVEFEEIADAEVGRREEVAFPTLVERRLIEFSLDVGPGVGKDNEDMFVNLADVEVELRPDVRTEIGKKDEVVFLTSVDSRLVEFRTETKTEVEKENDVVVLGSLEEDVVGLGPRKLAPEVEIEIGKSAEEFSPELLKETPVDLMLVMLDLKAEAEFGKKGMELFLDPVNINRILILLNLDAETDVGRKVEELFLDPLEIAVVDPTMVVLDMDGEAEVGNDMINEFLDLREKGVVGLRLVELDADTEIGK